MCQMVQNDSIYGSLTQIYTIKINNKRRLLHILGHASVLFFSEKKKIHGRNFFKWPCCSLMETKSQSIVCSGNYVYGYAHISLDLKTPDII